MTVRSSVVALLDPLFTNRVSADNEPRGGMTFPYVLVFDHVSENPALRGDERTMAWRRTLQVDLFQTMAAESATLLDQVLGALDGAKITGAWRLRVVGSTRTPDPDPAVVHHVVTCSVARPRS